VIVRTLAVGPLQTNCYLIGCQETRLGAVIDPGGDAADILAAVAQDGLAVQYVLLTHAHFDHIGAVAEIVEATRAPLALHPDDLPILHARGGAAMFGIFTRPSPDPSLVLAEAQTIEIGTLRLHVLHTPGHTPGHVTFHEATAKAAFDGDVLFQMGIGRTDFPGGSYPQLMDSIRNKLFTLPDETVVYPGHGPATSVGDEKRSNPFLA
jgi:glyoxylase-like metal-dependent hydrolase (beta-lactamase superfamily II)